MADLGSDISGVKDVDPSLTTVTSRAALAEAILRRLRNQQGQGMPDPENKDYGYDLRETIGTSLSPTRIEQNVRAQVLAEEEVEAAQTNVRLRTDERLVIDIRVEDGEGPFTLTVLANSLTVELLTGESSALV